MGFFQFTILLVGYFVLGPSDLYKLVKSIGSLVQNARTLGNDLTKTFESNMESQLQLEEIRKAQRELNDAFSFRRSINVDADGDAFATTVTTPREGWVEGQGANDLGIEGGTPSASVGGDTVEGPSEGAAQSKRKKLKRRRRVVSPPEGTDDATVPDLEMPGLWESSAPAVPYSDSTMTDEELARIEAEFDQYTSLDADESVAPVAATKEAEHDDADPSVAAQRFQQQLSGNWNQEILAQEDVLTQVMRKLALLEEEKAAATKRLTEEFEQRSRLEENFYQKQREVLESALMQVEKQVVGANVDARNDKK